MLTPQQVDSIVAKIQTKPKLPKVFKGDFGAKGFKRLIQEIDRLISEALPEEIFALVNSAADGLTVEETDHLKEALTALLNEKVKSPLLKAALPFALPVIIDEIITALQKGKVLA